MTVGQSFRPVAPHFPHRAETWKQKPTELGNILTILNLKDGNIGTGEPSLSSSQLLSISFSWWLWIEVSDLLCFYAFSTLSLLAFWFSLIKTPSAFCSLYIWNFGLDSPQQTLLKNLRGDLDHSRIFGPCRKTSQTHVSHEKKIIIYINAYVYSISLI